MTDDQLALDGDGDHPRDRAGRRRSPATMPGYHLGRIPSNFGKKYPPESFKPEEILRMLNACQRNPVGMRTRGLIIVMWRTGLRISEALNLQSRDLNESSMTVAVREGKSPGVIAMDEWGWKQLAIWLEFRKRYPEGPVFCVLEGPKKGVEPVGAPSVRRKLFEIASRAGVTRRVNPHGFRHTFAAELSMDDNVDILHIQRQLRHTTLQATANYLNGIAPATTINVIRSRRPAWLDEVA